MRISLTRRFNRMRRLYSFGSSRSESDAENRPKIHQFFKGRADNFSPAGEFLVLFAMLTLFFIFFAGGDAPECKPSLSLSHTHRPDFYLAALLSCSPSGKKPTPPSNIDRGHIYNVSGSQYREHTPQCVRAPTPEHVCAPEEEKADFERPE